jgi:hypothetical protein
MPQRLEYTVVRGFEEGDADLLHTKVTQMLAEGWELAGGVSAVQNPDARTSAPVFVLFQALVRRAE